MKIQTLLKKPFNRADYLHIVNGLKTNALIIYPHTDEFIEYLTDLGYQVVCILYGYVDFYDMVIWRIDRRLKCR